MEINKFLLDLQPQKIIQAHRQSNFKKLHDNEIKNCIELKKSPLQHKKKYKSELLFKIYREVKEQFVQKFDKKSLKNYF